jgi:hypothetical protein
MLSLDLVLMLRNPFRDPSTRAKYYFLVAFVQSFASTLLISLNLEETLSIVVVIFNKVLFFGTIIPALVYTFFALRQPGLSKQYRSLLIRRQASYVVLLCLF